MKKVYFYVNPLGPVYYMEVKAAWAGARLDIGYNDSYEMRSTYLVKPYFSEDYKDIKELLEKNKKRLMCEKYEEIIKLMKIKFNEEDATYHDGFDAPC